jgi:HEAT repeat protein
MNHMHMTGISTRHRRFTIFRLAVLSLVLSTVVLSQGQTAKSDVDDAINEIKQGQVTPVALQRIARAGATEAVPLLHEQFVRTEDDLLKEIIASTLVRLGDKEQAYWAFLENHAKEAVNNDAPFPFSFDAQGSTVNRQLSGEFLEWTKINNVNPKAAATAQMYTLPAEVTLLAATGDPRALPVLRKAMSSHNYLIQAAAANGLAKLQDTDSVPLIIASCKRAPSEAAALIARSLVFFNNAQAQAASETFIHDREVLEELRKLSKEKGISALF